MSPILISPLDVIMVVSFAASIGFLMGCLFRESAKPGLSGLGSDPRS